MALDIATALVGALLVVPVHPLLGICVTGWSLASLVYQRRTALAWVMGIVAGALATLLASSTAYLTYVPIYDVPVTARAPLVYMAWATLSFLLAGPVAAKLVQHRSAFEVFAVVSLGLFVLQVAVLWQFAAGAGMGLVEYVVASVTAYMAANVEVMSSAYPALPDDTLQLLMSISPSVLVSTIGLTGLFAVSRLDRIATRARVTIRRFPALASLDLSPLLTLLPISGAALLAASMLDVSYASMLQVVGINLVLVSRWVFFFQGLAVSAGLFERAKFARSARAIGYGLLAVAEVLTYVVSLIGLADIWVNIRQLSREGTAPGDPGASSNRG